MPEVDNEERGRKVFFLNPHHIILEESIPTLVMNEYEVYAVRDHTRLLDVLREFPASMLFINLDTEIKGFLWKDYIKSIASSSDTKDVKIGVISSSDNKEVVRIYEEELKVGCGYLRMRFGQDETTKLLLKTLRDAGAIGQRKYVRAKCDLTPLTSFNVKHGGRFHSGTLFDVSSAGMACSFDSGLRLESRTRLPDIQLKLRGRLVRLSGIVAGRRAVDGGRERYVILFDKDTSGDSRQKIHLFIHEVLQAEMDQKLSSIEVRPVDPAMTSGGGGGSEPDRPISPDDFDEEGFHPQDPGQA